MKYLSVAAFVMAVVLGDLVIADECVDDLETQGKDPESLYLHYFFRTRPHDKIPKGGGRFPDFPPSKIASFRVEVGDSFDLIFNKHSRYSGEIRRDADSYQAVLDCIFVPRIQFKGEVALDEIFAPRYTENLNPFAADIRIVLSRSKNVQTFLKLQAKIDSGEVEETGAAEASHRSGKDKSEK